MSGSETVGTMYECMTLEDVDTRLEGIFTYFDQNTTKLMIYLGRYMDQRPDFGANAAQNKQGGPLFSDFRFWRGGFGGNDFLASVKSGNLSAPTEGKGEDGKELEVERKEADLAQMQMIRRRASILGLQKSLTSDAGRRLSSVEKTAAVVEAASKLAAQEDEEEEALGLAELFEEDLPEEEKTWKHLPYVAVSGNEVDEALAEQLNVWEIDVDIHRLKNKSKKKGRKAKKNKNIYKVQDKKYIVRFIHGVLLCKALANDGKKKHFEELIPLLREVAGMPNKKKGITIHS